MTKEYGGEKKEAPHQPSEPLSQSSTPLSPSPTLPSREGALAPESSP